MHADDIIIISTERDIGNVHLLMHAGDIIIISTERDIGERKVKVVEEYCECNHIRLQPTKCGFIVINGNSVTDITV